MSGPIPCPSRLWRPACLRAGGCADPALGREHLRGLSLSVPLTDVFGWLLGICNPPQSVRETFSFFTFAQIVPACLSSQGINI